MLFYKKFVLILMLFLHSMVNTYLGMRTYLPLEVFTLIVFHSFWGQGLYFWGPT